MKEATQKVPWTSHASTDNIYPAKMLIYKLKHLQTKLPENSSITILKKLEEMTA